MLHHLKPTGRAGIVLANGSMSSSQNNEGVIGAAMVDADVVDVMVALPGQLFFNMETDRPMRWSWLCLRECAWLAKDCGSIVSQRHM